MSKQRPPQPFERFGLKLPEIIFNNFIGGASWAFGATVGLAVIVTVLTLIVQNVDFNLIPVVGSFVSNVIDFVMQNNPNFHKTN